MSEESDIRDLINSLNGIQVELREMRQLITQNTQINAHLAELIQLLRQARQGEAESLPASEAYVAQQPPNTSRSPDKIKEFLELRGIQFVGCKFHSGEPAHYFLDDISRQLGDNYTVLGPFITQLRGKTATGEIFNMSIKELEQKQITFVCSIADRFKTVGLLSHYLYHKSPKCLIEAAPARTAEAINFINGQWLEKYIAIKFNQLATQSGLPFSFMQGVHLDFPGGEHHEIDFLAELDGVILWIECKSGEYRQHVANYARMQRLMWLSKEHVWLIVADSRLSDKAKRAELERVAPMRVLTISETAEAMGQLITERRALLS